MKGFLCALGVGAGILVFTVIIGAIFVITIWWALKDKDDLQKRDGELEL